jgi:hypothetical protein
MSYPPEISEKCRKVLEVIFRGHPERTTWTSRGVSKKVSAVTWSELQIALNASFDDIENSIANLVSNKFIESGLQNPTLWRKLQGEKQTPFFWITATGEAFLKTGNVSQRTLTKAVTVEQEFQNLKQAIATISPVELNDKELSANVGMAAAILAKTVADAAKSRIDNDDDRLEAGLHAFAYANYFSWVTAASFEISSALAVLELLGVQESKRCIKAIISSYNDMTSSNNKSLQAIGITCERWHKSPSYENFSEMVELYSLSKKYISIVLDDAENEKASDLQSVEGAQRSRVIRALATIGIQLPINLDDRDLCQKATVAIVRKAAKDASQQPVWLGAGHRFTAAITGFTIANELRYRLAAPFEQVASTAVAILLGAEDESDFNEVNEMAELYNDLSAKPGIVEAIGKSFSEWLATPSSDNYRGLVAVYQVLAERATE